ncbi:MAG TPA: NHL repeat-containing protein [Clostridia bacterium]|nr:NHL repeat-containing protein [Clostridia bacterium]
MKRKAYVLAISTILAISLFFSFNTLATPYSNYTFDYKGDYYYEPQAMIPDAFYDWTKMISGHPNEAELRKTPFNHPEDFLIAPDGFVFISDTGNNRVVMLDDEFKLINIITGYETEEKTEHFKLPTGLALDKNGYLYVCDTGNKRIVKYEYTASGEYRCIKVFDEPELPEIIFRGVSAIPANETPAPEAAESGEESQTDNKDKNISGIVYQPMCVAIDKTNRIYVLSRGLNQGILELDSEGNFAQFIAPARVTLTPAQRIRRFFSSEEQLRRDWAPIPPVYNSMAIDDEGFLYVTTASIFGDQLIMHIRAGRNATQDGATVRRVNAAGIDVLKRKGNWPPVGDILLDRRDFSHLIDVAVYPSGIYSILDRNRSKVFTYDQEGKLLFIFGCKGNVLGAFDNPIALGIMPDNKSIAVLDGKLGQLNVYRPTEYAEIIFEANRLHSEFKFEESNEMWERLLSLSSNSEIGYVGKGKYEYQQGNYKSAMHYFKMGNDRDNYSKALEQYRKQIIERVMPSILWLAVIGGLVMAALSINKRIQRIRRGERVGY